MSPLGFFHAEKFSQDEDFSRRHVKASRKHHKQKNRRWPSALTAGSRQMRKTNDGETTPKALTSDKKHNYGNWIKNFLAIRPLLFKSVGRIVRPHEIEDIVQETFILSYAASRKNKIKNPRGFMMRTAKNIALNITMRADRRLHFSIDDLLEDEVLLQMDKVEERYLAQEMFIHLCRAVAELPVCCRRVFILKKIYGLSQKEIAERLGISDSMVEKHVAKGMEATGKYMVAKGYWDESGLFALTEKPKKSREAGKP